MPATEKALLVGASGRVGTLLRKAWALAPPDKLDLVFQWRDAAPCSESLIWDPLEGPDALAVHSRAHGPPKTIMMLAGGTPATAAHLEINRQLAVACLEAARAVGTQRVLVASSAVIYGPGKGIPFSEETPCAPVSPYGFAKRDMEHACTPYRDAGMEVCCLRIGSVLGADALMLNAASMRRLRIDRFADGNGPIRSFVGPLTLSRLLETLCTLGRPLPDTLNVGAPCPLRMSEIATAAELNWQWRKAPEGAVQDVILDCTRLAAIHGFSSTESSAKEMIAQLKEIGAAPVPPGTAG